jgi:hypothetical protein
LSKEYSGTEIHRFVRSFIQSKNGELTEQSNEVFIVNYPNQTNPTEYTYEPSVAREKKSVLITFGSQAFQQILAECQENGVLCQILVKPKEDCDKLLKEYFKDSPFACQDCNKGTLDEKMVSVCVNSQPCYHKINNGKIVSVTEVKKEPIRYYQFYYSASFKNKLRPQNEEIISILVNEQGSIDRVENLDEENILGNEQLDVQDFNGKLKISTFETLKAVADQKLEKLLKQKLIFFDLPLVKEKKFKLKRYEKRLRRERLEVLIAEKDEVSTQKRPANYKALLKREEESLTTKIAVKFINLLVINTSKITFDLNLDNNSTIRSRIILGVNHTAEVTCPICHNIFSKGYATQDTLYVCGACVRQSIDTGKIYSKKTNLKMDETLKEYIEKDSGFVCAVCGKRYSRLLEFKCNHDYSSVCVNHYGVCDICGRVFSNFNLAATHEFRRKLCPKHAVKCENCQSVIGVDESKVCKATGKKLCSNCVDKIKV